MWEMKYFPWVGKLSPEHPIIVLIKIAIWGRISFPQPNILIIAHWLCNYLSIFLSSPITMLELPVQPQLNPINNDQHFTRLDLDAYIQIIKDQYLIAHCTGPYLSRGIFFT